MRAESENRNAPFVGLFATFAMCTALFLVLVPSAARAAECPNEAIRAEQGPAAMALPDCRAYELVSPGSIPSMTSEGEILAGKASPEGDGLAYYSRYPAEGSQTSSEAWLSRRTDGLGWTVTALAPQMTPSPATLLTCQPGLALSEDLSAFVLSAGGDMESAEDGGLGKCSSPAEELVPGEPRGYSTLYFRRAGEPYALVSPVPLVGSPANATFQAASSDLSRIVFSEAAILTPEAVSGSSLYEWAGGAVRAIGVLPNGEQVPAKLGAATHDWGVSELEPTPVFGLAPVSHAVSADGERVFFEANGSLYLRENAGQPPAADASCLTNGEPGLACTWRVDVSRGGLDPSGGGFFQFASRDGSRVFFTSDHRLTSPSSAKSEKPALYEYRVDTRELVDLTVNSSGLANVRGISGGSDDGSHVYFVARGILTGAEENGQGEKAIGNEPNLYLVNEGALSYVATLSPWGVSPPGGRDRYAWWEVTPGGGGTSGGLATAWSPSGRYLVFASYKPLTGFDNTAAEPESCTGEPACKELFLFDSQTKELACISCSPAGARPGEHTRVPETDEFRRFASGARYAPRAVLDSGQVFFQTVNALSPQDVNEARDVYEYDDGTLSLISSGAAMGNSGFIDASADGSDVFFVTPEALVRSDKHSGQPSIYDARIGGGFIEPPPPPEPCASEQCRPAGPPAPPAESPATAAFAGSGNVKAKPCKAGKVRRGNHCVKKAHRRRHGGSKNRRNS